MLRPFTPEPYTDYKKPENEKALREWINKHKEQFPLRIPLFIMEKKFIKMKPLKV
jgi:hypothetical protein